MRVELAKASELLLQQVVVEDGEVVEPFEAPCVGVVVVGGAGFHELCKVHRKAADRIIPRDYQGFSAEVYQFLHSSLKVRVLCLNFAVNFKL